MVVKTRTGLISRRGNKYAISLELSKNFQLHCDTEEDTNNYPVVLFYLVTRTGNRAY